MAKDYEANWHESLKERSASDCVSGAQSCDDVLTTGVSATGVSSADVLAADSSSADVLVTDGSATDTSTTDRPITDLPAVDVSPTGVPTASGSISDLPATRSSTADLPAANLATNDVPATHEVTGSQTSHDGAKSDESGDDPSHVYLTGTRDTLRQIAATLSPVCYTIPIVLALMSMCEGNGSMTISLNLSLISGIILGYLIFISVVVCTWLYTHRSLWIALLGVVCATVPCVGLLFGFRKTMGDARMLAVWGRMNSLLFLGGVVALGVLISVVLNRSAKREKRRIESRLLDLRIHHDVAALNNEWFAELEIALRRDYLMDERTLDSQIRELRQHLDCASQESGRVCSTEEEFGDVRQFAAELAENSRHTVMRNMTYSVLGYGFGLIVFVASWALCLREVILGELTSWAVIQLVVAGLLAVIFAVAFFRQLRVWRAVRQKGLSGLKAEARGETGEISVED
ncbi:hypothetical protein [Trueperella sp. LYQ143]|uniref:hypothetical protein n=1 Tax=Trueperella sp. LYQ143 TaxID=3391059 RepID=UPI0039839003